MWVSAAWAHGSASGALDTNLGPLVFIPAAVLFVLFLVFMHRRKGWVVLVAGGAGAIGGVLVPKLLKRRHRAVVLDLYPDSDPHGDGVFEDIRNHVRLRQVKGDIADDAAVREALKGCDAVINLAPVNDDALAPFVRAAKQAGVRRFIHALPENGSSENPEKILADERGPGFVTCVVEFGESPPADVDSMADHFLFLLAQPDARIAERSKKPRF